MSTTKKIKATDGTALHTISWLPEGDEFKGLIFIAHGYAEHSGRYDYVARTLVDAGYAVFSMDHRGHGKSEGERVYIKPFSDLVTDFTLYVEDIRKNYPNIPYIVLGHSMGSMIALKYALRHQNEMEGMILSGIAITADEMVATPIILLANLLKGIIPTVRLIPPLPSTALSVDESVQQNYDNDPLNDRGSWRIGSGASLLNAGKELRQEVSQLTLPLLIVHGEDDEIAPASGAKYVADNAQSQKIDLHIYPSYRHEILNEPIKDDVLATIVNWLGKL